MYKDYTQQLIKKYYRQKRLEYIKKVGTPIIEFALVVIGAVLWYVFFCMFV